MTTPFTVTSNHAFVPTGKDQSSMPTVSIFVLGGS